MTPDPHEAAADVWNALGGAPDDLRHLHIEGRDPVYPSTFAVGTAAAASTGAATLAAARIGFERTGRWPEASINTRHAAIAFRSERYLRVGGAPPPELWNALSGYYQAAGGHWVQLHTNFAHHLERAARVLDAPPERAAFEAALRDLDRFEVEERLAEIGGCGAALRTAEEWAAHPQARAISALSLLSVERVDGPKPVPLPALPDGAGVLDGLRVLDLSRILAGPVAGRTLAAHGADVLRVGAAHIPTIEVLVLDTGFGKRFAHLDLRTDEGREALAGLVGEADVFIQAYRPGAIAARGFGFEEVARLRPGIVYVSLCAWSEAGPWAARRGFDSLVQTASGIAHEGGVHAGQPGAPVPLPAQALDHATGYLAAAGAMMALARRAREGGSYHVRVSLAQTGRWLAGLPRIEGAAPGAPATEDVRAYLDETPSAWGALSHVRPPGALSTAPVAWATPPVPASAAAARWR
ncbi:MAG: CoA transferase [Dehalococcoidia bacterium]|nr:CoA transferase [Dehalococcoidia bacterium]